MNIYIIYIICNKYIPYIIDRWTEMIEMGQKNMRSYEI